MTFRLVSRAVPVLLACAVVRAGERAAIYSWSDSVAGTKVLAEEAYSAQRGYGFEALAAPSVPTLTGQALTGSGPALFSVKLPEGTYLVKVTLGGPSAAVTTVKSECHQLQAENVATTANGKEVVTFAVNIRTAAIPGGDHVRLKRAPQRNYDESTNLRWDDKLTVGFGAPKGKTWAVQSVEVTPAPALPVLYLVGDSTVCDQPGEPYNSWGQMLPRWFGPGIAVANHAESGEAYNAFLGEKRWEKILSTLKPGDFVLMQMGHNDEKVKQENYANTGYAENIGKLVSEARAKGATPVVMTPMHRYTFKGNEVTNSHGQFPDAARNVARAENAPLIDLLDESETLYETLGPEGAVPLFAPQGDGKFDHTHHSDYGSYELSRCVARGVASKVPELAKHLRPDAGSFDPARPDRFSEFAVPENPRVGAPATKPAGN